MSNKKILVLPGDGIGVEVMQEVLNIINWMVKNKSISFVNSILIFGSSESFINKGFSDSSPCGLTKFVIKNPLVFIKFSLMIEKTNTIINVA